MELALALHNLGALATLALGVLGLLRPQVAAELVGVIPRGRLGTSEIRATYGGLFAALGAFVLVAQDSVAFIMLGAAWLGTALGRLLSVVLDESREPRNFAGVLMEGLLGMLLLVPS